MKKPEVSKPTKAETIAKAADEKKKVVEPASKKEAAPKKEEVKEVAPKKEAPKAEAKPVEAKPVEPKPAEVKADVKEGEHDVSSSDAYVSLRHIDKVYDNKVQAVFDFTLDIKRHEFIVFVGPSGCGKSTTLRMIAGLEDITAGELYIDGQYSNDKSPKDRDIAMVFQSYALYPHMTVYNNMAFGLKIRHLPKAEIDKRVHDAAKILQIEEFLDRKPKALSGGQRQRVALGRAIVRNAKVFLMDEPLSNLDAKLRVQMRSEIIKLHEALDATTIYVTHDQTEAMTMATRIVVMKLGRVQQIGSPIEIYNHPANLFVAGFIGSPSMNFLKATYEKGELTFVNGVKITVSDEAKKAHDDFYVAQVKEDQVALDAAKKAGEGKLTPAADDKKGLKAAETLSAAIKAAETRLEQDQAAAKGAHGVVFGIRPEDIHEGDEEHVKKYGAAPHEIVVSVAELLGHEYYVHSDFSGIDLVAKIPMTHEIKIGDKMNILFENKKAHIFDPLSEKRIF
jgi:multiple sugar transport system ATP-binding protein